MKRLYEKDKLSLFQTVVILFRIAMKHCIGRMIVQCVLYTFYGVIAVLVTCATQWFFDTLNLSVEAGMVLPVTYLSLLGMIFCIFFDHVLNGWQNYNSTVIHIRLIGVYQNMLNRKAGKIETRNFESQEFLQTLEKAVRGSTPEGATFIVICILNILFCYVPYIIAMSVYLYFLHPSLVFSIFLVFVPVFITQIIKIRLYDTLEDNTVQDRREYQYYEGCMVGKEMKETRTLGAYSFFMNLYRKAQKRILKKEWKTKCCATKYDVAMKGCTLLGYFGVLFLLIVLVLRNSISVGAFAAIFSSISVMFERLQEMINSQLGGMFSRAGLTSNFVYFLSLPERGGEEKQTGDDSGKISLEHVSFSYPGSDKPALKDVNLSLCNETVAVVGENGAGKSTLVKLLTGIYKPDSGRVTINGLDTATASLQKLCARTSGVFQKYEKYKMTLRENVEISKMENVTDEDEIYQILDQVSIQRKAVDFLPDGLNTILSAEFDGIELSGGQWQRVAIARGLHREHEIIVLDEPTSAIDPIQEKYLYEQFSRLVKGKTALIVTHRMGSARIADKIIVMDAGSIVEMGTHDDLMEKGGRYAEMFQKQAAWYRKETTAQETEETMKKSL